MSEFKSPLTGEERRARIRDIRERKGHFLGMGIIDSGDKSGYVTAYPGIDPMKYSVPVQPSYIDGCEEVIYAYKGIPRSSIRPVSPNISEFV